MSRSRRLTPAELFHGQEKSAAAFLDACRAGAICVRRKRALKNARQIGWPSDAALARDLCISPKTFGHLVSGKVDDAAGTAHVKMFCLLSDLQLDYRLVYPSAAENSMHLFAGAAEWVRRQRCDRGDDFMPAPPNVDQLIDLEASLRKAHLRPDAFGTNVNCSTWPDAVGQLTNDLTWLLSNYKLLSFRSMRDRILVPFDAELAELFEMAAFRNAVIDGLPDRALNEVFDRAQCFHTVWAESRQSFSLFVRLMMDRYAIESRALIDELREIRLLAEFQSEVPSVLSTFEKFVGKSSRLTRLVTMLREQCWSYVTEEIYLRPAIHGHSSVRVPHGMDS